MMRRIGVIAAALCLPACVHGGGQAAHVSLERRIILASEEAGSDVAAYAVFVNRGASTSVVEAQCDCSGALELHRVNPGEGMAVDWPLALPAASHTAIEPPGVPRHMMAVGLLRPQAAGETVTIRFRLAEGNWITGDFSVVESSGAAWEEFDRLDSEQR